MGKSLPVELRVRVVGFVEEGHSRRAAAGQPYRAVLLSWDSEPEAESSEKEAQLLAAVERLPV